MNRVTIESLLKAANSSPDADTSVSVAKRKFLDEAESIAFFNETRSSLFSISEWRENSSATDYDLFDESGEKVSDGKIVVGRFVRIKLYGGGKYDWVRVISIVDDPGEVIMTVNTSYDPTQRPIDTKSISHFFGPEATNNFCVQRDEKTVAFYVIGLNEKQNVEFTDSLIESTRNAAVANVGYYSGIQKAIWKQFCLSFVRAEDTDDR